MSEYILWCLIEGAKNPFPVDVLPTLSIDRLKQKIKSVNSRCLENFDANDLSLWKVDVSWDEKKEEIESDKYRPASNLPKLDDMNIISNVWERLPDRHIHVFVGLPDQHFAERCRLDDPKHSDGNILWLRELHARIWGRKDLMSDHFRQVKVTRAHYDALQDRLNQKHADRDSAQYRSTRDRVVNDKLDILALTFSPEALHPDKDEDQVVDIDDSEAIEDDSEIDSNPDDKEDQVVDVDDPEATEGDFKIDALFPSTFRYLDLSSLGLEASTHRFPLPLLLREEYDHITRLIDEGPKAASGSVIVSGQPGTGKTSYLYLRIIQFLFAGHSFVYQKDKYVHHVSPNGVKQIGSSWVPQTPIVAFIDADEGNSEPRGFLLNPYVKIILASSPQGAHQKWLDQIGDATVFRMLGTRLWSPRELFLTGIFLNPRDITVKRLSKATMHFGYNPRLCFSSSHTEAALDAKILEVMGHINRLAKDSGRFLLKLKWYREAHSNGHDISHTIFRLSPTTDSRRLGSCRYDIVSQWALDYLLRACEEREANAATKFYAKFRYAW